MSRSYEPTEIDALIPPDQRPPAYNTSTHSHPTTAVDERSLPTHSHPYDASHPPPSNKSTFLTLLPRLLFFILLFLLTFASLLLLAALLLALLHPDLTPYLPTHRSPASLPLLLSFLSSLIALTSLFTFSAPSLLTRISHLFSLALTLLSLLIILLTPHIRHTESWLGITALLILLTTLITALGASAYTAHTQSLAAKQCARLTLEEADMRARVLYEEGGYWTQRLKTGLKIASSFIVAIISAGVLLLITLNLLLSIFNATALPYPTSRLISVQPAPARWPYNIHLACTGRANDTVRPSVSLSPAPELPDPGTPQSPTVLYESPSGIPATLSGEWLARLAQEGVSRTCIYDRPGYGFSDSPPSHTTPHLISALSLALTAANESGPYILVGAGYGGILTRLFAQTHPNITHSLLYIDSDHPTPYYEPPPLPTLPSFLSHLTSPLGLSRIASLLRGQSTRLSRTLGPTSPSLLAATLAENLQSHRRDSVSSIAINSTARAYPHRKPHIVLSSRRHIDSDPEPNNEQGWERTQRRIWAEAVGEGKVAWRILKEDADICSGVRGEGECRRAVEELLLL